MVDETTRWGVGALLTTAAGMLAWAFSVERRLGKSNGPVVTHMQKEIDGHTHALSKDRAGIAALNATVAANTHSVERMETALAQHIHDEETTLQLILDKVSK